MLFIVYIKPKMSKTESITVLLIRKENHKQNNRKMMLLFYLDDVHVLLKDRESISKSIPSQNRYFDNIYMTYKNHQNS